MEYLNVHEISKKWNMKERRITSLCRNGRINGVKKTGNTWLIPSDSLIPLDKRTKEYDSDIKKFNYINSNIPYTISGGENRIINAFKSTYLKKPSYTTFTPYIVSLIGAHVEQNKGISTGFAIDRGIHIAYDRKMNGIIEIKSLQFSKRAQWHVLETPYLKENDWADCLRGATISLLRRYPLKYGMSAIIDGELPIKGLSSSSSMIISFIRALAFLNNIQLNDSELIDIINDSFFHYLKINDGNLRYYAQLFAKKDKLMCLDMLDKSYSLVDMPKGVNFSIGLFFSGVDNASANTNLYVQRIDELKCSAYILKALSNVSYDTVENSYMRDIPYEVYLKYKDKLPENFTKRVEHFYSESERVIKSIEAYQKGDLKEFGRLITESGYSTINNWQIGSKELIYLYELLKDCNGIYGCRFLGSGFKECCVALVDPTKEKYILDYVRKNYTSKFPELINKYSGHICHTADGVKLDN